MTYKQNDFVAILLLKNKTVKISSTHRRNGMRTMKKTTITATVFADSDLPQGVDHEFGSTDLAPLTARLQELDRLLKDQTGNTPALALQNEVGDVLRMAKASLETVKDTLFARSMTELADSGRAKDALAHFRAVGAKNGIQKRALQALEKANAPQTRHRG